MCEHNGNDGESIVKSYPNRSQTSKDVSKKEGKIQKWNADVHFLNKTSVESIQIEDNKTTRSCHANSNVWTKHKPVKKLYRYKRHILEVQGNDSHVEILLPQGVQLSSLASIDVSADDVGHALQFLEFCEAFRQVNATLTYFGTLLIMEPRIEPGNPVLIECWFIW